MFRPINPRKADSALAHIERNGDLLFWPGHGFRAAEEFRKMKRAGQIAYNPWSGKFQLTDAGCEALKRL